MRMGRRLGRLGGVSVGLIGLASTAQTGCTMPVDGGPASNGAEEVATTAAAESAVLGNVDCQTTGWNVVQAFPVSPSGGPVVYQGSVSTLLASLCTAQTSSCDPYIYDFTQSYYYDILGAAGYYYVLHNFYDPRDMRQWISIPIIDSQVELTAPVSYDPAYPGLSNVRFPYFSPGSSSGYGGNSLAVAWGEGLWPESNGVPEGSWVKTKGTTPAPFQLRATDYSTFTNVMTSAPANDSEVAAWDQTCVLIVDQKGVVLDFSAHLGEWDPNSGCAGCGKQQ
jgi:hypothetical protein